MKICQQISSEVQLYSLIYMYVKTYHSANCPQKYQIMVQGVSLGKTEAEESKVGLRVTFSHIQGQSGCLRLPNLEKDS